VIASDSVQLADQGDGFIGTAALAFWLHPDGVDQAPACACASKSSALASPRYGNHVLGRVAVVEWLQPGRSARVNPVSKDS
jgi:hypothetical protein